MLPGGENGQYLSNLRYPNPYPLSYAGAPEVGILSATRSFYVEEEKRTFRRVAINAILATDMKVHFELSSKLEDLANLVSFFNFWE